MKNYISISENQRPIRAFIIFISFLFLPACAQRLVIGPSNYPELELTRSVEFHDTLDKEVLKQACIRQLEVLDGLLSKDDVPAEKRAYYEEMADITRTLLSGTERLDFERFISENFEFYRAGAPGSVLFTGYYTPLLFGSRTKDGRYQYPVYGVPDDLVFVDLARFGKNGKIKGTVKGRELVPYYRREEIESEQGFNQAPIFYVDNKIDLFFLHIQGSGVVQMDDGSTVRLNYADNNGFSYMSIGKQLILDKEIPKEQMSMEAIKEYFQKHPEKIDYYFNQNPSYVFFKEDLGGPYGSTGAVVTPSRSIAADANYFPKYGLAYIETEIPDSKNEDGSVRTTPLSAMVFDQDSGGAIKGAGRVDIYFGEGDEAAFRAGFMKYNGSIYYLKKKR
ncbi:MAG: MltA domain-containing protein [Deltaproteobacteria bacterium]|nr:MltA domain-containing protein [Deltaproteobacteria bacterium]